ncbi:hypothetical protein BBO99_00006298 [Phytophthora kernoviae]|uniref:Uncharacterized protein n=2 Tax=Phytophthora kernoviae TaxID=325452 RepID=A0A3R7JWV1_9STRA|nr:hypothetical protein G195_009938 [Phytophthora kernoviae 00238/432]KAG2511682.1 hypothetical protein JM16_006158 [Phytophthora kernoviae]KAG2513497.1 hypothetical protein JM18_008324 [Phytophthora kernoviae]RLN27038.1 hypothetical protein BBI17_006449 [Phytophthora kernoviae]RLN77986.1 hypothetical protein BBO99_00006298 [Phytophthora kernoviae]
MSTYPLRGVLYFLGDQHLWRLSVCPVLLTLAVACGVVITLFTFTLRPQEEALYDAGLSPFFAWLLAIVLVIIEVFIVTLIYGLICLEWFKDKIFAHVLSERGYGELVENEERHSPLLRVLTSCCRVSVMLRLGLLVITLPLNMIPVLGNITIEKDLQKQERRKNSNWRWSGKKGSDKSQTKDLDTDKVPLVNKLGAYVPPVVAVFVLISHTLSRQRDWLDNKDVPEACASVLALCIIVTEIFVTTIIYGFVCLDYYQDKIFAFVLRDRGLGAMLGDHEHRSTAVRVCTTYFLSRSVLGFISLPLHCLPILGSVVYAWLHGSVLAWEYHLFYFELKGIGYEQQHRWVGRHKLQYSNFGVKYFLGHPALWKQAALPLLLTLAFSFISVFVLFGWTLRPQENWMYEKGLPSVLAWIFAVIAVLVEIFLLSIVYAFVVLEFFKDKIFAFVLRDKELGFMVDAVEQHSSAVRVCTTYCRVDGLFRIALLIISLPLNLIPVVGTLLFAWLHGSLLAWEYHLFYFDLKGLTFKQQQRWIRQRKWQYSSFGMQALLLQMIPLVGPLFIFSNTCGAALLAVKMERNGGDKWQDIDDDEAPLVHNKGVYGTV